MFRFHFLWKLYASYVVLILITTTIVSVLVAHQIEADSLQGAEHSLRAKANLVVELAHPLLTGSAEGEGAAIQARLDALGPNLGFRVTIINADGEVLADSHHKPSEMDNHANRPEILIARDEAMGSSERHSNTIEKDLMYVAMAIREDGQVLGYARVAQPLVDIYARLATTRRLIFYGALGASVLALCLGYFVARRITTPLTDMTRAADAISEGDYELKLPFRGNDEIGTLAQSLNSMSGQLRDRMQTILSDRNKLAAILGSMVEGVVAVDKDERVVHMNEAARSMLKVSGDNPIGLKIWEATRVREVCQALADTMRDESDVVGEVRFVAQPSDHFVEIHASTLRDSDGLPSGAVVLLHDVTDLRRLEVVRRDFVANVSHELKTPLTAIRGLVETLLDDDRMDHETHQRFLNKVHMQAMRLSSLVTDLLALSRVESEERGGMERVRVDLCQPVRESVRNLRASGEDKNLDVSLEIPAEPVEIMGDEEALRQAIDNLLTNAIKYTPDDGRVWVRVMMQDDRAVVEVEDTGIGIEPKHRDRIFERFYRVDKARSRELGGTGLGLSIVKHIAMAHSGKVSVASVPGQGSTFRLLLPVRKAAPKLSAERADA